MTDKRAVCSLVDSVVIDYIPPATRETIDRNVGSDEDIRAAVKGIKGEALVVTDRGAYVIKRSHGCRFFPYDIINGTQVSRVFRRGQYRLLVEGEPEPRHRIDEFEPDPSDNVVNFPWSKAPLFSKADEALRVAREGSAQAASAAEDGNYECLLEREILRLNERLEEVRSRRASGS